MTATRLQEYNLSDIVSVKPKFQFKENTCMLQINDYAPDFTLPDVNGNLVTLSSFKGSKVVLYFYPKDNTPGCTRQACAFAADYSEYVALGVKVIGISKDSAASHVRFAGKYSLPFILLSDEGLEAIKAYDVWKEKKLYGKTSYGVVRTTFLIDENGRIEKIWNKANPDKNSTEILSYLRG